MLERFFTCDSPDCDKPSVRGITCERCDRQLCAIHGSPPSHACSDAPLSDDEFEAKIHAEVDSIRSQINEKAVCERAAELNHGRKCEIQHPPAWGRGPLMGCANYHARIRFNDDGSVWLLWVPRTGGGIPRELTDYLIRGEYATLKFLETTNVPAPRAFDYGLAGDETNKEKLWNGLADILIEIQHHPFSKAGSLIPGSSPSEPIVSALASERFLVHSPSGPFDTAGDYYTSFVEQNMALIADGQLFTRYLVNAYLVFAFLKS